MVVEKQEKTIKDYTITAKMGTVVVVTTFMVTSLFGAGICFQKIWGRLDHLSAKTSLYQQQFDELEHRVDSNDIQFAEIKKDVSAINKTMAEILERVK